MGICVMYVFFFHVYVQPYHAGYVTKVNINSETNKLKSEEIDVDTVYAVPHVHNVAKTMIKPLTM